MTDTIKSQRTIRFYACDYKGNRAPAGYFKGYLSISDKWNLDDCDERPDLVVVMSSSHSYKGNFRNVFRERGKWGFRNFFLGISGEATNSHLAGVDYSLSFKPDSANNFYFPMFMNPGLVEQLLTGEIPAALLGRRQHPKTYFCNFIYSNSGGKRGSKLFPGAKLRGDFALQLSQYKQVDFAGKVLNNTDRLKLLEEKLGRGDAKHQFMRDYRFSIAFENQSVRGYITEKIWDAYLAGTVPIYWGSPNIAKYFNPASFVNCHDYNSFDEVIEAVKRIDQDPELYQKYLNAPPLLPDSMYSNFTSAKVSVKMDEIMNRVIKRREQWEHRSFPKLYEVLNWTAFVMLNPNGVSFVMRRNFYKWVNSLFSSYRVHRRQ